MRFVHLRLVSAIGRIEPDTTCIAAQIFERGLLIIDQRDHDLSITCIVGTLDQREIAVENTRLDHRIARHFERIMFARAEQRGRHRHARLAFDCLDRSAGSDAAMQGNVDNIVGRLGSDRLRGQRGGHCIVRRCRLGRTHDRVFRQFDNLERPRPIGQPTNETAFFQCGDKPVDPRLALEVQRLFHFLEAGGNTGILQLLLDEADQFVLLGGQHGASSRVACSQARERMRNK